MKKLLCILTLAFFGLLLTPQQVQAQYYCSYGVAYGTSYTWQSGSSVYFYSSTELDYCAGLYYDPATYGRFSEGLWASENVRLLGEGYTEGYADWVPAEIYYSYGYPYHNQYYNTDTSHYVLEYDQQYYCFYSCGYYWYDPWGWGFTEGGYGGPSYYGYGGAGYWQVRRRRVGITTHTIRYVSSTCQAGNQFDSNGNSCPAPTPTPTPVATPAPTPKVSVTAVGFKGDWDVKKFVNGEATDPVIAPGDEPTWVKGRDNDGYVVAYTMGQSPTIFATFTVSQADSNASATVRVKRGDTVMATFPLSVSSNGDVSASNIALPAQLGETVTSREKNYNFDWEVSINGGAWKSAGESGDHKIYWTFGDPYGAPNFFRDSRGREYPGLYDLALEKSIGKLGDGTTDVLQAIKKINEATASEITYDPSRPSTGGHPLSVYKRSPKTYQCDDNAFLLRGLLRSAGTDGDVNYYYGGNPGTLAGHWYIAPGSTPSSALGLPNGENTTARFSRRELVTTTENIGPNPYFTFHATVTAGTGTSSDPSYCISAEPAVKILQAVDSSGTCVNGEAANNWKVTSSSYMTGGRIPFNRACGNSIPGGTGTPRAASVISQSVPTFMEAGASYLVSVTLQNNGDNTWTDADLYRLGAQNPHDNYTWGMNRVALPQSVAPGQQVTVEFYVTAPYNAGYYNFQWRMVQDGVEWFGDLTPNVQVEVYSLYTCDPWQEQDCWNRGGSWDSSSCYCYGGYYYY